MMSLPDLNAKKHVAKYLPILVGVRVKLSDDQRQKLKNALSDARNRTQPKEGTPIPGSGVRTQTAYGDTANAVGLGHIGSVALSDLISTRESIPLPTLIEISKALNVELITEKDVMEACKSYCKYNFGS